MTSTLKNVYIDKLDEIVDVVVKPSMYIDFFNKITRTVVNLKLMVMLEYQNIKIFLKQAMFQIGLKKFMWLKKIKSLCRELMLLVILKVKKFLERFTKKDCKKTNKKELRVEKLKKEKAINYMLNGNAMIVFLIVRLIE